MVILFKRKDIPDRNGGKSMSLAFGILGFLNYKPMSGYDLVKAFDSSVEFFWHAQNSHIYLELKKLEKQGYIKGETVIQEDRPNKKIYSITDSGREEFMAWLAKSEGEEALHFKSAFLMKVFFGGNMPPEQSAEMLRQFKAECESYLRKMGSIPESIESYGSGKEAYQTLYWQFTADFGRRLIETFIEWAGQCIDRLEAIS